VKPKPGERKPIVTRAAAWTEKALVAVMLLLMILILLAKAVI